MTENLVSPRLARLERDLAERGNPALEEFWTEVEAVGTPLIEPIEGDDQHSLVTFLWRQDGTAGRVGLIHGPLRTGELVVLEQLGHWNLFHLTHRTPNDLRNWYWFVPDPPASLVPRSVEEWKSLRLRQQSGDYIRPDALNTARRRYRTDPFDPDTEAPSESLLELPNAPQQPFDESRTAPQGTLTHHLIESDRLTGTRPLWLYDPPVDAEVARDVLIVFDAERYIGDVGVATILDHLLVESRIRPTVAVFVPTTPEQRPVELPCNDAFADFLAEELVPWIAGRFTVTDDPARTTLAGASYGALAASFGALRHPERFGNVLAQSGSYWWEPIDNEERYVALDERSGGWLPAAYAASATLPIRFYLDVGSLEASPNWTDQCRAVRGFRDVLLERGYEVTHHEFRGGHSYECWRYTFADGLISLVGTEVSRG